MKNKELLQEIITKLLDKGADKVSVTGSETCLEELQHEYNEIDLLRGYKEDKLVIKVIKDNKMAKTSLNQLSGSALDKAIEQVLIDAENSQVDAAYDISPYQEHCSFEHGPQQSDRDRMYLLVSEFLDECNSKYPALIMEGNITHFYSQERYLNSNGVDLVQNQGGYYYVVMFTSREGKKVSSFNYSFGIYPDLQRTILEMGLTKELIEQSVASMECRQIPETFEGDVILVPGLVEEFLGSLVNNQLTDRPIITDNSILKGKIGEKVLNSKITLCSNPIAEDLAGGYFITEDGFTAEKVDIFKSGILKNYMLTHFGSRKTGLPMSKAGGCLVMEPGKDTLAEMISEVKRGLLVVRFSGGNPSMNGDFSGVAKNSYYIEDGEIKYPVNETMIAGNLLKLFNNVNGISDQTLNTGNYKMPWLSCAGVTISR